MQKKNYSIPLDGEGGYEKCEMFNIAAASIPDSFEAAVRGRTLERVACTAWHYVTDHDIGHGHTIVRQRGRISPPAVYLSGQCTGKCVVLLSCW